MRAMLCRGPVDDLGPADLSAPDPVERTVVARCDLAEPRASDRLVVAP